MKTKEKNKEKVKERKIPEKKLKAVEELADLIKTNKTFMIVSLKNLPSRQFQEIKKSLRDKAKIKIVRKNIAIKALKTLNNDTALKIDSSIEENCALIFSNVDCFELSAILSESKIATKAKAGQEAIEDISVEAGPTDMVPGPVISEFGALGIKIAIEEGKINIKENKVIAKKGEKVSENAAGMMSKLGITPFFVGLIPISAYDSEENKIYVSIVVNKKKTLDEFKNLYTKSKFFAVSINYTCEETIGFLLAKANAQAKALGDITNKGNNIQNESEIKLNEK